MSETTKSTLTPVAQKFILHWGEMGTRWGINRTVAQVHALLFLSPHPLPADEISETLAVARSNVSTSLRELQGWRIVRVVHVLGDRRDHFESIKDVWEIFRIVSEERKRREIDPTLNVLAECVREVKSNPQGDAYTRERLESMLEFLSAMTGLFEEIIRMPTAARDGGCASARFARRCAAGNAAGRTDAGNEISAERWEPVRRGGRSGGAGPRNLVATAASVDFEDSRDDGNFAQRIPVGCGEPE